MAALVAADRARQDAIDELMKLGAIRSHSLVGDLGEALASSFYGVGLEPPSTPGYDLITPENLRVQVRTLRCSKHNFRTRIGRLREPYDVLLAIRLDEEYAPTEALEIPREVIEDQFEDRTVTWTRRLASDPRVRRIAGPELLSPG
jgi:hypothetical protein